MLGLLESARQGPAAPVAKDSCRDEGGCAAVSASPAPPAVGAHDALLQIQRVPVAAEGECPAYGAGERSRSHTEAGILASPVTQLPSGELLVADFGVDWRHVKSSTASDPVLRTWLDRFEHDETYELQIVGFSDCVGAENNNIHLRQGRARNVEALLGPSARSRVEFRGMQALGQYVNDNGTQANRARNRSVLISFQQNIDIDEPLEITARLCGPDVTSWLLGQMRGNIARVEAMAETWPTWIPFFNLGYYGAAIRDFRDLVRAGGPWDFKAHARTLGWLHDATRSCPSAPCNRTVTLCGDCYFYDVPGNIHFGWIGRHGGWAPWLLHYGADRAQAGGVDDPRDAAAIDIGIRMADQGTSLCDELRAHRNQLNIDQTEDCAACSGA